MNGLPEGAKPLKQRKRFPRGAIFLWLAVFVPNLIVLLGVYPGFFVYDAQDELMEVVTRTFNTHHPLLHVLAMGGTVTGVHKLTDSWNLGIFTYLALQAFLISAIYAYILKRLSTAGHSSPDSLSIAGLASTDSLSTAGHSSPDSLSIAGHASPDSLSTAGHSSPDSLSTAGHSSPDSLSTAEHSSLDRRPTGASNSNGAGTGLSRRAVIGFTLWYALFPTVVMYTLCSTKDGLFSAFATLFVAELAITLKEHFSAKMPYSREIGSPNKLPIGSPNKLPIGSPNKSPDESHTLPDTGSSIKHSPAKSIISLFSPALIISASAMMLLRNNAVYALVVYAVILVVGVMIAYIRTHAKKRAAGQAEAARPGNQAVFYHAKKRAHFTGALRIILCIFAAFIIYVATNKALIRVLHASDNEHQESITVAIQAIGRAWNKSPESFSAADAAELTNWFTEEGLAGYEDRNSDFLKSTFNNARYETNSRDFWNLWFRIGKKCPAVYLKSWILTSSGMWNPFGVINTYEGHTVFTFTYTESSYFGYETELPGVRTSFIPAIDSFYRWLSLDDDIQRIPVISLLFAPAFWFWIYAAAGVYLLCKKRIPEFLTLLPLYLLWLTYLLGPASLVRYALPFFTALPVMAYLLQSPRTVDS